MNPVVKSKLLKQMTTILGKFATEKHTQYNHKVEATPISEGEQPAHRVATDPPLTISTNQMNKQKLCTNPRIHM